MPKTPALPASLHATEAHVEVIIHAPLARVWKALVSETTAWWPKSFYTSERTKRFVIQPRLGGRVGEETGPGEGLTWYTVIGVDRPHLLLLAGYLLPPWAGPATSLLRLALTNSGPKETKLEITDSTFGKVAECDTADGWRQIFDGGLRTYLEAPKKKRR
jgi:uncharacterized protein YndB with AHSA1/START domain